MIASNQLRNDQLNLSTRLKGVYTVEHLFYNEQAFVHFNNTEDIS